MKTLLFLFLAQTLLLANTVCQNQLFTLSAYKKQQSSIEVATILKELSSTCKLSIVFNDDVSKKMLHKKLDYVNINDYTFEEFLNFLFNEANLFYEYNDAKNIISVHYLHTKTFHVDYIYLSELSSESSKSITTGATGISSDNGSSTSSNDHTTISSKSKFTFWENLQKNIYQLFPSKKNIKIFTNKDASLLTVTATKKDLNKVAEYLDILLTKMHKEVTIEAKIIELTYDDSSATGIDWSQLNISFEGRLGNSYSSSATQTTALSATTRPTYNLAYKFSTSKFLNFLKNYGSIEILSNPRVVTMNNQPAVINVGEQISYRTSSLSVGGTATQTQTVSSSSSSSTFVGVTLYVIPEVSNNNQIIMKINPVVSKLSDETIQSDAARDLPPDTKVKQMTSIVRVKNNEKIVIGGLVSVTKGRTSVKVPLLGNIPVIGTLFSHSAKIKKKTEMFIIIQPHVVTKKAMPGLEDVDLKDSFFHSTFDKNQTTN